MITFWIADKRGEAIWFIGLGPTMMDITMAIFLDRLNMVGLSSQIFEYNRMPCVEEYYHSLMKWEEFKKINSHPPAGPRVMVKYFARKGAQLFAAGGVALAAFYLYKKYMK